MRNATFSVKNDRKSERTTKKMAIWRPITCLAGELCQMIT